jgi:ABC-type antimicrobial peptide transport system permease subunit
VGVSYFETMGIDVIGGRGFDRSLDRADGVPVVVVSRALADRFLGGEGAIGQRMRAGSGEGRPWWTIVGIVDDIQHERLGGERGPAFYILTDQIPLYNYLAGSERFGTFVIRSDTSDPIDYAAPLRRIVAEVDGDLALTRVTSLDSLVGESVARSRFTTVLMGLFSVLALLLGGVGIYGVTSFVVEQRRREIGIRKAVGARDSSIATLILRTGMTPVAVGMGIGAVGALATSHLISGLLYGVGPMDWPTYAGVVCVLGTAAVAALWYPARRAARLDPVASMRNE